MKDLLKVKNVAAGSSEILPPDKDITEGFWDTSEG
jgi:hypothetical protein